MPQPTPGAAPEHSAEIVARHCPRCGRATDPSKRHQHWKPWPHEGFTNHLCQPILRPGVTGSD